MQILTAEKTQYFPLTSTCIVKMLNNKSEQSRLQYMILIGWRLDGPVRRSPVCQCVSLCSGLFLV